MDTQTLSYHSALIYLMVTVSAADSNMTDTELDTMAQSVLHLPVFRDYNKSMVVAAGQSCAAFLEEEDGLDRVLDLVSQTVPSTLRDTAYALACQVAVSDGHLSQEELRLLEMIRDTLDIDRLSAAAIERGVAALYRIAPKS